jgi:exoribonuclease R
VEKELNDLGRHTSFQERAAEKAEREGQKVKQLAFMAKKIGVETLGRVTHVTEKGAFVEMDPWGIEGSCRTSPSQADRTSSTRPTFVCPAAVARSSWATP